MDINKRIIKHFKDSAEIKLKVKDGLAEHIAKSAQIFFDCVTNDGKIMCCGNGGSARINPSATKASKSGLSSLKLGRAITLLRSRNSVPVFKVIRKSLCLDSS